MKTYALNSYDIRHSDKLIFPILFLIVVLLFISVFLIPVVFGDEIENLGRFGRTYPIEEPDALAEIKSQAEKTDWNRVIDKERVKNRIRNYKPDNLYSLPKSSSHNKFLVDMTYVSEFDVTDAKGKVIYPKGYSFNPLDYVSYPNILVVINGYDSNQTIWFEESHYFNDYRTKILLSDGSYFKLSKRWERPVYYLTEKIARRLKLRAVPSIVRQVKRFMEVEEIVIDEKSGN